MTQIVAGKSKRAKLRTFLNCLSPKALETWRRPCNRPFELTDPPAYWFKYIQKSIHPSKYTKQAMTRQLQNYKEIIKFECVQVYSLGYMTQIWNVNQLQNQKVYYQESTTTVIVFHHSYHLIINGISFKGLITFHNYKCFFYNKTEVMSTGQYNQSRLYKSLLSKCMPVASSATYIACYFTKHPIDEA